MPRDYDEWMHNKAQDDEGDEEEDGPCDASFAGSEVTFGDTSEPTDSAGPSDANDARKITSTAEPS